MRDGASRDVMKLMHEQADEGVITVISLYREANPLHN